MQPQPVSPVHFAGSGAKCQEMSTSPGAWREDKRRALSGALDSEWLRGQSKAGQRHAVNLQCTEHKVYIFSILFAVLFQGYLYLYHLYLSPLDSPKHR